MVAPPSPCMSTIQSAPHRSYKAKVSACFRNATSRGESLPEGRAEARPFIHAAYFFHLARRATGACHIGGHRRPLQAFFNKFSPHLVHVQSIDRSLASPLLK